MEPDDEGLPPEEWTKGEKRFAVGLLVVFLLFLAVVALVVLGLNHLQDTMA